ncbi:MAG: ChbG/HpnK family deacetylase [Prevotellaceae bacterium]|nr:ChbG/HpnK family deacetylase [Prevotellaceae bacterium]
MLLAVAVTCTAFAQEVPTRVIIRGDDMGSFHSANLASIEAFKNGIETSIELMVVTPWFPEAVKMLKANTGIDVGLHLVPTSEWDNIKWRPLTSCPSLTDKDGYFYPKIFPDKNYPGQSIMENGFDIGELEREYRAQIELALREVPQISHLSGHMGALNFTPEVAAMVKRLSEEYDLPAVDAAGRSYQLSGFSYNGAKGTSAEKEASFIKALDRLEAGKNYVFVDHPAYNNIEMETVGHIGYEDVATDRQGVTDTWTSERVKQAIKDKGIELINYTTLSKALPRSTPAAEKVNVKRIDDYWKAVDKAKQDIHSLMIVRNGKVVYEHWVGDNAANKPHVMNSVSKAFTSTAVGFAVSEGLLKVTDKVISFFPDKLPAEVSQNLKDLEVRHLLTMNVGHESEPRAARTPDGDWVKAFLAHPIPHKPGTYFLYNSMGTYMLSAIVQKVTGQRVLDYLNSRLFRPLGIVGATWQESPQGINCGGWGLYVKTEDMAKLGLLYLQKGMWNGKRLLPEEWIAEASANQVPSLPAGAKPDVKPDEATNIDWLQGYGYQLWQCRHHAYRADGANGQYIIMLPEKNTVIVTTANVPDMQKEINLIWKHLLPALR